MPRSFTSREGEEGELERGGEKGEEWEEETVACSWGVEIENLQPYGCNGMSSIKK